MNLNQLLSNRIAAGDDDACDVSHDLWSGNVEISATHDPNGPNPIRLVIGGAEIHLDPYKADALARQIDFALQDYTTTKLEADSVERMKENEGRPF